MAQDENKAESSEFRPTLTDTLYLSLQLPESEGRTVVIRLLLEEVLTTLIKRELLSTEELRSVLERTGKRVSAGWESTKQAAYEAAKEKGYPDSYVEEVVGRFIKSSEDTLSSIRERVINKSDQ